MSVLTDLLEKKWNLEERRATFISEARYYKVQQLKTGWSFEPPYATEWNGPVLEDIHRISTTPNEDDFLDFEQRQERDRWDQRIAEVQRLIDEERQKDHRAEQTKPAGNPAKQTKPAANPLARSKFLRAELERLKWTKYDLADKADMDPKTVKKILDAEPVSASTLDKLRRILPKLP